MTIDASTLLFFDASCLVAASRSPSGGSGFLLSLRRRYLLRAAVSPAILIEAERNVRENMTLEDLGRYHGLVVVTPFVVIPVPPARTLARYAPMVTPKDAHVVAAALAAAAP